MNDKIAENLGLRPLSEVREEEFEQESLPVEVEEDASMAESKLAEQRDAPILREWEK